MCIGSVDAQWSFSVFGACVVQFRLAVAIAVFGVVSGLDMLRFGGLCRFLICLGMLVLCL